jgi:very-short-patch-repair endonuclease
MPWKDISTNLLFNAAPVTYGKAKKLRNEMTPAEKVLWSYLRNRKFKGLKFRRQHPIDRYIVDFVCLEQRLVVEADGYIHRLSDQKENEIKRTKDLESYGLKAIRLSNEEILENGLKALKKVEEFLVQGRK